jgi:hypothetical protein
LTNPYGIAALLYGADKESAFNANSRIPDQPHYGGEAHFAHGLWQEGGENWNRMQAWLGPEWGQRWRDPELQTRFVVQNLKQRYQGVWNSLQNARNADEAAAAFSANYLAPAQVHLRQRLADIQRGGARRWIPAAPPQTPMMAGANV